MHRDRHYYRFPLGTVVIVSVLVSVSVSVLGCVNTPLVYIQYVNDRTIVTVNDVTISKCKYLHSLFDVDNRAVVTIG